MYRSYTYTYLTQTPKLMYVFVHFKLFIRSKYTVL